MVIIEYAESDKELFESFIAQYPDNIVLSRSKKFIGGTEIYELLVVLTPTIISSLSLIVQNVISYKQAQYTADKGNMSELKIRVKNKDNEYEIVFKSSSITDKDDLNKLLNDTMEKICISEKRENE